MDDEPEFRRTVRLVRVPIGHFMALQLYFDDMVREFQLIAVGTSGQGAAARLADLAVYVQQDISRHRNLMHMEALAAQACGLTIVDLSMDLQAASAGDARRLIEVAEELDGQSRSGLLLTAPASPIVIDLLRWIVDEVEGQLGNDRPPQPFGPT